FGEPRLRRCNYLGKGAEFRQQRLGERLDVAARQRAKQPQLQQLIVRQSVGADFAEAAAQAFAMTVIVRRGVGKLAITFALLFQNQTPSPRLAGGSPQPWPSMPEPENFAIALCFIFRVPPTLASCGGFESAQAKNAKAECRNPAEPKKSLLVKHWFSASAGT